MPVFPLHHCAGSFFFFFLFISPRPEVSLPKLTRGLVVQELLAILLATPPPLSVVLLFSAGAQARRRGSFWTLRLATSSFRG